MSDNATPIATLIERAEEYTKSTIEFFTLNAVDKSADVVSSLVSRLAVFIMVAVSILISSIGMALWLGKLFGETFYGFFAIGAFYMLVAVLMQIFRHKWLKYPVSNSIIKQMLKQKGE